jgi:hypothetical protein
MGVDFLERAKKTINASYDTRRYVLAMEDLLTRHPECARYAGRMRLRARMTVEPGEHVLVEERNGWLFASRGMDVVGDFRDAPAEMKSAVKDHGGAMQGVVDAVMELSNSAEVVLCP